MYNSVKSFGQFLIEAVKTAASTEAKMKGLKGDGHGGWYDAKGKFVAKTVNGKLQFTGGGGAAAPEDPKSTKVATPDPKAVKKKGAMPAAPKPQPVTLPKSPNKPPKNLIVSFKILRPSLITSIDSP